MQFPRVARVITKQGTDLAPICNAVADKYGFPPRLIVACAIMESNLDERSERRATPPDVSAGLFHQTVQFAQGFGLGDGTHSAQNVAAVFQVLKTDLPRAADIAGRQLGSKWQQEQDGKQALSRYNSPGLRWEDNPNRNNIQRGWDASAAFVVEGIVEDDMVRIEELQRQLADERQWGTNLLHEVGKWADQLDAAHEAQDWDTVRNVANTMQEHATGNNG